MYSDQFSDEVKAPEPDEPEPDAETASPEAVLLSKCLGVLKEIRVLIQQALDR